MHCLKMPFWPLTFRSTKCDWVVTSEYHQVSEFFSAYVENRDRCFYLSLSLSLSLMFRSIYRSEAIINEHFLVFRILKHIRLLHSSCTHTFLLLSRCALQVWKIQARKSADTRLFLFSKLCTSTSSCHCRSGCWSCS